MHRESNHSFATRANFFVSNQDTSRDLHIFPSYLVTSSCLHPIRYKFLNKAICSFVQHQPPLQYYPQATDVAGNSWCRGASAPAVACGISGLGIIHVKAVGAVVFRRTWVRNERKYRFVEGFIADRTQARGCITR